MARNGFYRTSEYVLAVAQLATKSCVGWRLRRWARGRTAYHELAYQNGPRSRALLHTEWGRSTSHNPAANPAVGFRDGYESSHKDVHETIQ